MNLGIQNLISSPSRVLIFPENPDADAEGSGYRREGVGEFFEGFVMLAQLYYKKTGKRCRFQPMCGHKHMRTLTFCPPIEYDPDNDAQAERERIVAYAHGAMQRVWQQEEALWREKQA